MTKVASSKERVNFFYADNIFKMFGPRSESTKFWVQIWIRTIGQSDGILERIFQKHFFRKNSADNKKACKIPSTQGVNTPYGPPHEKTCFRGFANNKGSDQPAHPCSLISAFVIPLLDSIVSKLARSKISFLQVVSVAEQAGLGVAFSETPKTGFLMSKLICYNQKQK